jgi:hypothetical protein
MPCVSSALPRKHSRTQRSCIRLGRMSNAVASERLPLQTCSRPLPPIGIVRLACLSSFYRFLIRVEIVASNPCDQIQRPRTSLSPPRGLSAEEAGWHLLGPRRQWARNKPKTFGLSRLARSTVGDFRQRGEEWPTAGAAK